MEKMFLVLGDQLGGVPRLRDGHEFLPISRYAPQAGRTRKPAGTADQRRHERLPANGRKLQLLIDGSPTSFALHNISEGGAMGDAPDSLAPGTSVHVRFEGGLLVPATVKWAEDGLIGLAFDASIMLDRSAKPAN